MKKISTATVFFIVLFAFLVSANQVEEQFALSGAAELENYTLAAREFDTAFSFTDVVKSFIGGTAEFGFANIMKNILRLLFSELYNNMIGIAGITATVFCLGFIGCMEDSKYFDITFYVCAVIVFSIGYKMVTEVLSLGIQAMEAMKIFMAASVPVLGGLMAASGGVARCVTVSAAVISVTTVVDLFIKVLMPICTCTLILCCVNSLSDDFNMSGLESGLQKFVVWAIGIIMVIFTGLLSIFMIAGGCSDNLMGKTAKFMAGSLIPIVGGVVSDTLDTVIACSKLIKGAVGAGAIYAVLYICLVPAVKIASVMLLYNVSAAVISPVADKRIIRLIGGFSVALKLMLAAVISSAIMFIVTCGMIAAF